MPAVGRTPTERDRAAYIACVLAPPKELRLDVGDRTRPGRFSPPPVVALDADAIRSLLDGAGEDARAVLVGGEPTLHPRLPDLIRRAAEGAAHVALETDGLALGNARTVGILRGAGLDEVRVRLAAARSDAHDWVTGVAGAGRRVLRSVRACSDAGIAVRVDVLLTRPTLDLLDETVAAVARLGARAVVFSLPEASSVPHDERVTLLPPMGLLEPRLRSAVHVALRLGLDVALRGIPKAAVPEDLRPYADTRSPEDAPVEVDDVSGPEGAAGSVRVVSFGGEAPVACSVCADRGEVARSTRDVRRDMARSLEPRPELLRIASAGSLWHPAAPELLREAARLDVGTVEVWGDLAAFDRWSDDALHRVRRVRVFGALYGPSAELHDAHAGRPGAFAATLAAVRRLEGLGVRVRLFGILHAADDLAGWGAAWESQELPGSPRFRLSRRGGSLVRLATRAEGVGDLQAQIPPCLGGSGRDDPADHGTVHRGRFAPCALASTCSGASRCPGLALGWTADGVAAIP